MFPLGFVSAVLPQYTFEEVIAFAARHQFACVELMCWPVGKAERRYAGVTHLDVDALSAEKVQYIQAVLQGHRVQISGLGYYPNPLDPDPVKARFYVDHLLKVIRAAGQLGVGVVNTFIGRDPSRSVADNLVLYAERWPEIVSAAEAAGVRLGIENCPMLFTGDEWPGGKNLATSPALWDRLFERIPSPNLGLNYDPSHLVWQQMDYLQPLRDYRDRIFHVHLKDARVHREKLNRVGILATPLEYHSPVLPGRGDINWPLFFTALAASGYRGPVCLELEDRDYESSPEAVLAGVLQSRDFVQPLLGRNPETHLSAARQG